METFILVLDPDVPELALYESDARAAEFIAIKDDRYASLDADEAEIEAEILEKLKTIELGHSITLYEHRVIRVCAFSDA
jgi:hypothetical protein